MTEKQIRVEKMSGEQVAFDVQKLRASLERSGAGDQLMDHIISVVESELFDGISTKAIYKKAFALLRKKSRPSAARYKLKEAILELGPTGYPFEKFIGEILKHQGYQTEVGVIVQGHCVQHEVDVMAEKSNKVSVVECKFHSDQRRQCDVKIPLYIQSRFLDIERGHRKHEGGNHLKYEGWIFTNTRFTSDATQFGNCMGLKLVGWDYPHKGSLKERIDTSGLHPITCLTTITKKEKIVLLDLNRVLCRDLIQNPNLLFDIGVNKNRHKKIVAEAQGLCQTVLS